MNQAEREYREALDGLRFSNEEKERMMENLMKTGKQNGNTKRFPVRAALLAAALAVGCLLSIAAGLPARIFDLAVGGTASYDGSTLHIDGDLEHAAPVVEEDGKLWLVAGDMRTDITDLVDMDTPYIYDNTDPDTGYRDYLIVGGTVGDYGWYECFEIEKDRFGGSGFNRHNIYCTIDGVPHDFSELTDEQKDCVDPGSFTEVYKPWFQAALDQLGLDI